MKTHPVRPSAHRGAAGFSLAELMVVIVIIGLLATLVATQAPKFLSSATKSAIKSDLATIETAVDSYALENGGKYPESLEALLQPDENGNAYLKSDKIPTDPWKAEYLYDPPIGGQQKMRIYTLGKDGQVGGEGDDRDISNLMIQNKEI